MQERHWQFLQMFTCFSTCAFFTDSPQVLHVKTTMLASGRQLLSNGHDPSPPHTGTALERQKGGPCFYNLKEAFRWLKIAVHLKPIFLVSRAQVKPATLNPVTVKPVTARIFSFVRKLYGCQTLLPTFNRKTSSDYDHRRFLVKFTSPL